jgi:phosphoglucomutase
MMDLIRDKFVKGDLSSITDDESGIKLVAAEEFSYTDPVDGATTSEQGLILNFEGSNGDPSRAVFRLSGTGSAGATIRMYLERYEQDVAKHDEAAPVALKALAERAIGLVQMQQLTGRDAPTVIT